MPLVRSQPRGAPVRIIAIWNKLTRLAGQWPVAMLALGGLLTLVWIGALIWIVFLFVCDEFSIRMSQNDEKARRIELAKNRRHALYLASLLILALIAAAIWAVL